MGQHLEYNSNKKVDLQRLLPEQITESDFSRLIKVYEDTINNLYKADKSGNEIANYLNVTEVSAFEEINIERDIQNTESNLVQKWRNVPKRDYADQDIQNVSKNESFDYIKSHITSGSRLFVQYPIKAENNEGISLLEKIYRIADSHDAWLAPFDFIQKQAEFVGYDINNSLANIEKNTDYETEQQTRFMIDNLAHWYKIKTTEDSIKLLLFTFGLFGGLLNYYTEDYGVDRKKWQSSQNYYDEKLKYNASDLSEIPDNYFSTPHFAIWYDLGKSGGASLNKEKDRKAIVNAVNSIKPINKVFSGIITIFSADASEIRVHTSEHSLWRRNSKSLLRGTINTDKETGYFASIDSGVIL